MNASDPTAFAPSLSASVRLQTRQVPVGTTTIGGDAPIRVQSMTTTDTNDIEGSVSQSLRIVEAGGELVRLTTQGEREARNIGLVKDALVAQGCQVPIVADVHFNPKAAETAAALVDAVRINPGNYTGEAKHFRDDADNIGDAEWHNLIVEKLRPLVTTCKERGTAIRIGVNHGSLSDRIMAKYGDTSEGMVASCIEYLEAFEELDFRNIVISIKSSNTRVMVQTVRLLAAAMRNRGEVYPLHLGVTEAGSDAEGRIKSAAGIGALLADGLGDTIRVSLTEAPEAEIPVAKSLVAHIEKIRKEATPLPRVSAQHYSPYDYRRRSSNSVQGIGGNATPAVMVCGSKEDKPEGVDWVLDFDTYKAYSSNGKELSIITPESRVLGTRPCFVIISTEQLFDRSVMERIAQAKNIVLLGDIVSEHPLAEARLMSLELLNKGIRVPFVPIYDSATKDAAQFQLELAADMGGLLIDGLVDGICVSNYEHSVDFVAETADLLFQATRARFTRTEFISCPGCGRTLYDIQSTVAVIKERLGHLKGLKIGVMGCIVNGIGEMADADYGYVGAGRGMISLYRGKELIRRSIPQEEALDALEEIINRDLGKRK